MKKLLLSAVALFAFGTVAPTLVFAEDAHSTEAVDPAHAEETHEDAAATDEAATEATDAAATEATEEHTGEEHADDAAHEETTTH